MLGIEAKEKPTKPGFASLMKGFTNVDPYECILCGGRLVFESVETGYRAEELMQHRRSKLEKERGYWELTRVSASKIRKRAKNRSLINHS